MRPLPDSPLPGPHQRPGLSSQGDSCNQSQPALILYFVNFQGVCFMPPSPAPFVIWLGKEPCPSEFPAERAWRGVCGVWFLGKWSHPRPGAPGVLSLGGGGRRPGPGPPGGSRLARPSLPLPISEWEGGGSQDGQLCGQMVPAEDHRP